MKTYNPDSFGDTLRFDDDDGDIVIFHWDGGHFMIDVPSNYGLYFTPDQWAEIRAAICKWEPRPDQPEVE